MPSDKTDSQIPKGVSNDKGAYTYQYQDNVLTDSQAQSVYKLILSLRTQKKVRVGYNEAVKAVQNGTAELVVYALDAVPSAIVAPLPVICEQRGVQCVAVSQKSALGKACSVHVDVIACAIVKEKHESSSKLAKDIQSALACI